MISDRYYRAFAHFLPFAAKIGATPFTYENNHRLLILQSDSVRRLRLNTVSSYVAALYFVCQSLRFHLSRDYDKLAITFAAMGMSFLFLEFLTRLVVDPEELTGSLNRFLNHMNYVNRKLT